MSTGRGVKEDCVVDASVGIKLFLVEPLSDRADALFAHHNGDPSPRFYVPDLFFIECTNILWKYVWRFGYPLETAQQDADDLIHLPLQVVSTAHLVREALSLATAFGVTAYDAAYVALAQQMGLPLVTADESLVRCFKETDLDVRWLGDWP